MLLNYRIVAEVSETNNLPITLFSSCLISGIFENAPLPTPASTSHSHLFPSYLRASSAIFIANFFFFFFFNAYTALGK